MSTHSCAVCVTILSTHSKFLNFTQLHALTLATHSYALLNFCTHVQCSLYRYLWKKHRYTTHLSSNDHVLCVWFGRFALKLLHKLHHNVHQHLGVYAYMYIGTGR